VLGSTGRNFAAGMSGGVAYVYDADGDFEKKCNMAMVALEPVLSAADQEAKLDKGIWHSVLRGGKGETDEAILKGLIQRHFDYTGSQRARKLLDDWSNSRGKFVKVFPLEYKRALGELAAKAGNAKAKVTA